LSESHRHPRIPPESGGIQVNHCKTAGCANFGVPAPQTRGRVEGGVGSYLLTSGGRQLPLLQCHLCRHSTVLYSNSAIAQEMARFDLTRTRATSAACPGGECISSGKPASVHPELYYSHGTTRSGEPRYRCKACGSTFSSGAPVRKQRRPELNREVLSLVVNKVPMRRICEVLDLNPATLYGKLAYLAEASSQFSSAQEDRLASGEVRLARAYVSVDRQDHLINWGSQLDRRYTTLGAIGAVENASGYVLAMQLNFDPACNPEDIEADALACGDYRWARAYRRHARLWLRQDYEQGAAQDDVEVGAAQSAQVPDVESKPPPAGMQVHLGAMQYGMFFHLRRLLIGTDRIRFFLDRDPGLDSACLAALVDAIKARRADVFVVRGNSKELTVDKKKLQIARANRELEKFARAVTLNDGESLRTRFVAHHLQAFRTTHQDTPWFDYPLADMADPSKSVRYLTDFDDYDIEHLARLYKRATLRGVDRFFMQVRRRLSILERPIATANSARRAWHGYAAYSPKVAQQVLQIFRTYYNYALVGEDGKTPAMRLGLTDSLISLEALSLIPTVTAAQGTSSPRLDP